MTNVTEILKKAKALISDQRDWGKGMYASDKFGKQVPVMSQEAVCFCAVGAVNRILSQECDNLYKANIAGIPVFKELGKVMGGVANIVFFNDHSTHRQVMKAFDKAIENSEGKTC